MHRSTRAPAHAVVLLLLLAGCSSESRAQDRQPAASAFRQGACHAVADAVLRIGRDARSLARGAAADDALRAHLKADQDALDAARAGLDPQLAPAFGRLVVAIGVVRLRVDTGTFTAAVAKGLTSADDAVVASCTTSVPTG
ncbi:MAG: hypothetical protein ACXVFV_03990 [Mycobacteriales bacterium]